MMTIEEVMGAMEGRRRTESFHAQNSYDSVIVPYTCFFSACFILAFPFEHYRQFKVLLR